MRLYAKDHPEANGRMAKRGEHGYALTFPLASGETLEVMCGEETLDKFRDFLGSLALDTDGEVRYIVDGMGPETDPASSHETVVEANTGAGTSTEDGKDGTSKR